MRTVVVCVLDGRRKVTERRYVTQILDYFYVVYIGKTDKIARVIPEKRGIKAITNVIKKSGGLDPHKPYTKKRR